MENMKGTLKTNPAAVLFLGACPALVASSSVQNALGLGLATAVVLILSTMVLALLKRWVSKALELPMAVVITAFFASAAQMILAAYLPKVYSLMGIYLALTAVCMMTMNSLEGERKNNVFVPVMKKTLLSACAFVVVVLVMGAIREVFGNGSFMGNEIPFLASHKISVLLKAPGALMVYSILLAVVSLFKKEEEAK